MGYKRAEGVDVASEVVAIPGESQGSVAIKGVLQFVSDLVGGVMGEGGGRKEVETNMSTLVSGSLRKKALPLRIGGVVRAIVTLTLS